MDWDTLELQGWKKLEIQEKNQKRVIYKTPIVNGVCRTIRRSSELKECERQFAEILFPGSKISKKHQSTESHSEIFKKSKCEGSAVFDVPLEKVSKDMEKLDICASKLFHDKNCDVYDEIPICVRKLNNFVNNSNDSDLSSLGQ